MSALQRSNHVKINASNSGVPFLPELKDFENAYDAFLLDSSPMVKNFGDLNVSNVSFCGECVRYCVVICCLFL